ATCPADGPRTSVRSAFFREQVRTATVPCPRDRMDRRSFMKRIIAVLAASLMSAGLAAAPAFAQGKSADAPGHNRGDAEMGASSVAPGQLKQEGSARAFAPGQQSEG